MTPLNPLNLDPLKEPVHPRCRCTVVPVPKRPQATVWFDEAGEVTPEMMDSVMNRFRIEPPRETWVTWFMKGSRPPAGCVDPWAAPAPPVRWSTPPAPVGPALTAVARVPGFDDMFADHQPPTRFDMFCNGVGPDVVLPDGTFVDLKFADLDQARGRLHRKGQPGPVYTVVDVDQLQRQHEHAGRVMGQFDAYLQAAGAKHVVHDEYELPVSEPVRKADGSIDAIETITNMVADKMRGKIRRTV